MYECMCTCIYLSQHICIQQHLPVTHRHRKIPIFSILCLKSIHYTLAFRICTALTKSRTNLTCKLHITHQTRYLSTSELTEKIPSKEQALYKHCNIQQKQPRTIKQITSNQDELKNKNRFFKIPDNKNF